MTGARLAAIAAAAVCLLGGFYLFRSDADADGLRLADEHRRAERHAAAVRAAAAVRRPPFDSHALRIRADALADLGRLREAEVAYRAAARRDPYSWRVQRDWAVVLRELGRRRQAARQMSIALALNPRMKLPAGFIRGKAGR
jgi:Flp pilus assembly protein TadD